MISNISFHAGIAVLLVWVSMFSLAAAQDRLIGEVSVEQVLEHDPEYKHRMILYNPDPDAVAVVQSISSPVLIKCFYRNDCPDSVREVPRMLKTLESAGNPNISLQIIGVNYGKDEPAHLLEGWNIRYVPTFVVIHQDQERGRIVEKAERSVEQDLAEILSTIENP